jgi:hypothetical protein
MAFSRNSSLNLLSFPERLEYYEMTGNIQHNAMAAMYRDRIVQALSQVFGTAYTNEQYEALAWSGLFETDSWDHLSQSRKDRIIELINEVNKNCQEILCEAP